ncbi:hypothetical protein IWQ60_007364 [Tieghemiomyces parasiticus]|uniref:Myb-like domain-containing protein n=1 Tax=Tieghemiomyces parasiticus TaxID=78921 RepID=A0A9W7ZYS2_9FUNG|nr:hypothetical protein IWQ60_007364 [Tieghemiomyces parasiticus]
MRSDSISSVARRASASTHWAATEDALLLLSIQHTDDYLLNCMPIYADLCRRRHPSPNAGLVDYQPSVAQTSEFYSGHHAEDALASGTPGLWQIIASRVPDRTESSCRDRYRKLRLGYRRIPTDIGDGDVERLLRLVNDSPTPPTQIAGEMGLDLDYSDLRWLVRFCEIRRALVLEEAQPQ